MEASNPTALTRSHLQEKLQWAVQCASQIVIKEPLDEQAIKHAFWGYLQAYQQIRNYYAKWLKQTGKGSFNHSMDTWKAEFLSQEEAETWDLLNAFRNEDMHAEPIIPDISIQVVPLLTEDGAFLLAEDGHFLIAEHTPKVIILSFNNAEYNLTEVCHTGLKAMQQFIDSFDQVA